MKQLEVQIMGQNYVLRCPDGADQRLLDAVKQVDAAMCKIRDAGKVRARDRIAVLAALNLAFDTDETPVPEVSQPQTLAERTAPTQKLTALIARLDNALNRDNQLI